MRYCREIAKIPASVPALLDRVEVTVPGRPNQRGQVRGRCRVDGEDMCDVLLDDEKHTIIQNVPAHRIVSIVQRRVAAIEPTPSSSEPAESEAELEWAMI
jgi:hypothetical protein